MGIQLKKANDILRSVSSIIDRKGKTTNWEGISKKVKIALNEQHELLQKMYVKSDKQIENYVNSYPRKHKEGLTSLEIEHLIQPYLINFNMKIDKFNNALMGITGMSDEEDGFLTYSCDIITAIICGLENREMTVFEMD